MSLRILRRAGGTVVAVVVAVLGCRSTGWAQAATTFPPWLRNDPTLSCGSAQRFYDMCANVLTVFGQRDYADSSELQPSSNSQVHGAGVVVDRSACDGLACPNKVYLVDSGNNRILGYRSLGHCVQAESVGVACTNDQDCGRGWTCKIEPQSQAAAIALGQADFEGSSCNRDSNVGMNGQAAADSLCFAEQPGGANRAEFWRRVSIDVDHDGNLYVPDVQNNRVLKFNQPLSNDHSGGKGDTVADFVWGQPDMHSNAAGSTTQGLHLRSTDERSVILAWGVSADGDGGVWVADTLNRRVLHFPAATKTADLVVGAGSGACDRDGYQVCYPILARQRGDDLWVLDQNASDGLPFSSRFVVFHRDATGWAPDHIAVPLSGYRRDPDGPELFQGTGFIFKPTSTSDPYPNGYIWVNEHEANHALLIDEHAAIVMVIGGVQDPDNPGKYTRGCDNERYDACGQATNLDPRITGDVSDYRLCWPGGSPGLDDDNNLYLADEERAAIIRFKLPYIATLDAAPTASDRLCLPDANGGLSGPNLPSLARFGQGVGMVAADPIAPTPNLTPQLLVRSSDQYLVWNDYVARTNGELADLTLHDPLGARGFNAIDDHNRLWTNRDGKLAVYQLPLARSGQTALTPTCPGCAESPGDDHLSLQWADDQTSVQYFMNEWNGVAFDDSNPTQKALWVAEDNRILRIGNYDQVGAEPLRVDMVVGQIDKGSIYCNRDPASVARVDGVQPRTTPGPNTLCQPTDMAFDTFGNLYVVESSYECTWSGNDRVSVFMASDIRAAVSEQTLFPDLAARKVFVASSLTDGSRDCANLDQAPGHPVTIAFDSHNHMILANDGTSRGSKDDRYLRQLWFYKDPLAKWIQHPTDASLNGEFVQQQMPDAVVRLPMGVPGEIQFDHSDNLLVQDHSWEKVWLLNLDAETDPATGWSRWLVPTSWDADQDGIANLNDPDPYGARSTPTPHRPLPSATAPPLPTTAPPTPTSSATVPTPSTTASARRSHRGGCQTGSGDPRGALLLLLPVAGLLVRRHRG